MDGSETQNACLFLYTENMKQCRYEVYHPVHFLFGDESTRELNEGQRLLAELGASQRPPAPWVRVSSGSGSYGLGSSLLRPVGGLC